MFYLVGSIICSVLVGVIFKISRRYATNNYQVVLFNYLFALLFCFFVFTPNLSALTKTAPFLIYGSLGILLPTVFMFLIHSIASIGIVKTDAAQRLSLFIPILAAWLLFDEVFSTTKIAGILIGFLALFFILSKPTTVANSDWKYPILVFLGFGTIDILFKKIALYTDVPYATSLFIVFLLSLLVISVIVFYRYLTQNESFQIKNVGFGLLVGICNFGNILFYLKAHKNFAESPSTVFAGMNMGVIILGSLIGIFAFNEKLLKRNYIGLVLALVSIILIVMAQLQ